MLISSGAELPTEREKRKNKNNFYTLWQKQLKRYFRIVLKCVRLLLLLVLLWALFWNKFCGNNNNCGCVNQVTASPFISVSACGLRFRFVGQSKKLPRKQNMPKHKTVPARNNAEHGVLSNCITISSDNIIREKLQMNCRRAIHQS